ncbi:MAG: hypothetical protein HKP53_09635 [Eudoraea sp.]|nr:hypothetical protein [Eudoraea sp.]
MFEAWFRIQVRFEGDFKDHPFFMLSNNTAAQRFYLDGEYLGAFGDANLVESAFIPHNPQDFLYVPFSLNTTHQLSIHFIDKKPINIPRRTNIGVLSQYSFLFFTTSSKIQSEFLNLANYDTPMLIGIYIMVVFFILTLIVSFLNKSEIHLRNIAACIMAILVFITAMYSRFTLDLDLDLATIFLVIGWLAITTVFAFLPLLCAQILNNHIPKWLKILLFSLIFFGGLSIYLQVVFPIPILISLGSCLFIIFKSRKTLTKPKWALVLGIISTLLLFGISSFSDIFARSSSFNVGYLYLVSLTAFPFSLLVYIFLWLRETVSSEKTKASQIVALVEEKKSFLENQNIALEQKVTLRTQELKSSLENLKATQSQLIQSEKMASLGELTAGIAHEIQNPLNFVNNFSEVSNELIDEMNEELDKGDTEEAKAISEDIKQNLEKINHHGKRADGIVKGMLQHSRTSSGEKELTDINVLADEYLRLAYHGLRAKDKSFNATMETNFDESIGKISVVAQDIGRVILNLITNAFYAVQERKKEGATGYEPTVTVSTKKLTTPSGAGGIEIRVKDNGNGIPETIKEKIFQPFFTTKPTGQGTGLGLSMSYDIVTKGHGGNIMVKTEEGKGTTFYINLPVSK